MLECIVLGKCSFNALLVSISVQKRQNTVNIIYLFGILIFVKLSFKRLHRSEFYSNKNK